MHEVEDLLIEARGEARDGTVLLVHGAITAGGLRPLLDAPALCARFRVVHYDRRGYSGGMAARSIEEMASDAETVAAAVGADAVDVVGHSIGAVVAVQVALQRPDLVRSLVLVEPTWVTRQELLAPFQEAIAGAVAAYAAGQPDIAADCMLRLIDGDDYARRLASVLPRTWPIDAGTLMSLYFEHDLPATLPWQLSVEQAASLATPTLVLCGERSPSLFGAVANDVCRLLPRATQVIIPDATHNVVATAPDATLQALTAFLSSFRSSSCVETRGRAPA